MRQRVPTNIGDLHGTLISNVLSHLPTEDAVRTSVLSRDWKYKWTSIYNIDIDDSSRRFFNDNKTVPFIDTVTRILLCTQNSRLRGFRLSFFKEFYHGHFETWMLNVFMRNIQKLEITALLMEGLDLPWCFSGWTLLTILDLKICCTLKVPADNCFPNIITLRLCGVKVGDIKIMTTKIPGTRCVILSFPVMQRLELSNCEWVGVDSVEIQAPKLIGFSSEGSSELKHYEIKICGPKLVTFELIGEGIVDNFVLNSTAVTYVCLMNTLGDETSVLRAHKLLTKCQNLKCLRIAGTDLKALLHLKTGLVFESGLTPKNLAKLEEVRFTSFYPTEGHYDLAKYLLENAKNLKKMTILLWHHPPNSKKTFYQSLSELKPKGSNCEFVLERIKDEQFVQFVPWPRVASRTNGSRKQIIIEQ